MVQKRKRSRSSKSFNIFAYFEFAFGLHILLFFSCSVIVVLGRLNVFKGLCVNSRRFSLGRGMSK